MSSTGASEEFYNSPNLVSNFAALLGVDAKYIRRVEPVSESKRKRSVQAASSAMRITIENEPAKNVFKSAEVFSSILANVTMRFAAGTVETEAMKMLNVSIRAARIHIPMNSNETQSFNLSKLTRIEILRGPDARREQSLCGQQPKVQFNKVFSYIFESNYVIIDFYINKKMLK